MSTRKNAASVNLRTFSVYIFAEIYVLGFYSVTQTSNVTVLISEANEVLFVKISLINKKFRSNVL